MVGSDLPGIVRYKRYLVGLYLQYQVNELLLPAVALNIEFIADGLPDRIYIGVTDMPFIRPGMNRYAVGAETPGINGRLDHVGIIAAAAVTEGGDLIDVYRQLCHTAKLAHAKERDGNEEIFLSF
jgi:hypothetical protein